MAMKAGLTLKMKNRLIIKLPKNNNFNCSKKPSMSLGFATI